MRNSGLLLRKSCAAISVSPGCISCLLAMFAVNFADFSLDILSSFVREACKSMMRGHTFSDETS